jgi:hypothetical protein
MLSPAGISAGSFSTSISRSAAEALCRPSSTGLENGRSTRIVPEPGLLYLKWKIQLEETNTSHSPEHVGWRFPCGLRTYVYLEFHHASTTENSDGRSPGEILMATFASSQSLASPSRSVGSHVFRLASDGKLRGLIGSDLAGSAPVPSRPCKPVASCFHPVPLRPPSQYRGRAKSNC